MFEMVKNAEYFIVYVSEFISKQQSILYMFSRNNKTFKHIQMRSKEWQ
jgi:hypothetical protein